MIVHHIVTYDMIAGHSKAEQHTTMNTLATIQRLTYTCNTSYENVPDHGTRAIEVHLE